MLDLDLTRDAMKQAMKVALREWLDDKFTELGKWILKGIAAAALAGLSNTTSIAVSGTYITSDA